jgi:hypothetical protein
LRCRKKIIAEKIPRGHPVPEGLIVLPASFTGGRVRVDGGKVKVEILESRLPHTAP